MEIQRFKTSFLLAEYVAVAITVNSQPGDPIPKDNQISIPFYEVCFYNLWAHELLKSWLRTLTLTFRVQFS